MKANVRSVFNPRPIEVTHCEGYDFTRHDCIASALAFMHDNYPVRKVRLKAMHPAYLRQWEIWAESMVDDQPVFMGILENTQ